MCSAKGILAFFKVPCQENFSVRSLREIGLNIFQITLTRTTWPPEINENAFISKIKRRDHLHLILYYTYYSGSLLVDFIIFIPSEEKSKMDTAIKLQELRDGLPFNLLNETVSTMSMNVSGVPREYCVLPSLQSYVHLLIKHQNYI